MKTPDDILARDSDIGFLTLMKAQSMDDYKPEFVTLMKQAVMMSGYKYGAVKDKPAKHYAFLSGLEQGAYEKDKNAEHLVNIANYAMFRYMTDDHRPEYIRTAIDSMKMWDANEHVGTDSGASVTKRIKPKEVKEFIREHLTDVSAYPYIPAGEERI